MIKLLTAKSPAPEPVEHHGVIGVVTKCAITHPSDIEHYSKMVENLIKGHLWHLVLGTQPRESYGCKNIQEFANAWLSNVGGLSNIRSNIRERADIAILCKDFISAHFPISGCQWTLLDLSYVRYVDRITHLWRLGHIGKHTLMQETVDYLNDAGIVEAFNAIDDSAQGSSFDYTTPLGNTHRCSAYFTGIAMQFSHDHKPLKNVLSVNWRALPTFSSLSRL
ncbi:hypothetical protein RYA05_02980 [Pseudomonas syringae pv. actinidiae]|nr:hypothetical protein [Pseudomonas syringae pv. actinidiae]